MNTSTPEVPEITPPDHTRKPLAASGPFPPLVMPLVFLAGLVALAFPLLARLGFFGQSVGQRLSYPYFQGGSEGLILSEAAIIHAGGSIYVPFRADQFISAPYPPLYYYLLAWFWPAGANPNLFLPGRIISLASALACALLIAALVLLGAPRPARKGRWLRPGQAVMAGLAGLLFLTLPAVTVWAARVRADMLMTAWQMAGLVVVALAVRLRKPWVALLAIVPFGLALFTKQTALAGPAAASLYLALHYGRRWKVSLLWLGGLVVALGGVFLGLNLATGGELYRRLFKYHSLPWQRENFDTYFTLFYQENFGLLLLGVGLFLLALAGVFAALRGEGTGRRLDKWLQAGQAVPLELWYLLGSLVLLLGLGVAGADHNHFLPAEAATCAAAGASGVRLLALRRTWLALLALAGLWVQAAFFSVPASRYEIEFRTRDADYQRQLSRIIAYAASKPGPILSSEAGFYVLAGKATPTVNYYNDLFTLAALDKQGLYSEAGLLDRIRHKEFSLILAEGDLFSGQVRSDVWTPELVAALKENYTRKFTDIWNSYEPKP
ncbi:MAG TPA: hypothetical protein VH186_27235 [Chloroflexia bacterium]|nr:hypothetical protein [Chloroflexia bacterium]